MTLPPRELGGAMPERQALGLPWFALNKVEDDHSGVPFDPTSWQSDGRMYPPQSDMARASEEHAGLIVYRSRGHRTFIAANGAIKIAEVVSKKTVFQKTGADGKPAPE